MRRGEYPDPIGEGAMWEKESANGATYFSGRFEFPPSEGAPYLLVKFAAFEIPGDKRTSDKSPDFRIVINSCEKAPPSQYRDKRNEPARRRPAPVDREEADEDIPF